MRLMSKSRYISAFIAYLWFYDSVPFTAFFGAANITIWQLLLLGGKYYYMALSAARRWPRSPCLADQKDFLNNPSKHMLYAIHKSWSPFMALVWLPNIKKISSTNPANIRCLLIIKIGHIGANNLFPNVMQIENYLFSSYLPYIQKREYIDGMALPYVGGDPSIAKRGGHYKVISKSWHPTTQIRPGLTMRLPHELLPVVKPGLAGKNLNVSTRTSDEVLYSFATVFLTL